MTASRVVKSIHGIISTRRVEDPPDVVFVGVARPSKNGGVARKMVFPADAELSLEVESFVRIESMPLKVQEDIHYALKKRQESGEDKMQLCDETVVEISMALERKGES